MLETTYCYYAVANSTLSLMLADLLREGTIVSVKLAGWDNTVSRKRTNVSPVRAKMVAPVWIDIMATPVSANLDSEVVLIIIIAA